MKHERQPYNNQKETRSHRYHFHTFYREREYDTACRFPKAGVRKLVDDFDPDDPRTRSIMLNSEE